MRRALVVVTAGTERDAELVEEGLRYARGTDAELIVLGVITRDEYENDRAVLDEIERQEHASYEYGGAAEYAERTTETLVREVSGDSDAVERVTGAVIDDDTDAELILEVASEHECDHIFLRGKRRSPAGKAVFGDMAQRVILGFDGYVTVSTSP